MVSLHLVLLGVSQLQLQLVPNDPDRSGGLEFLGYSPDAFLPVVIAASTAVSSVLHSQALQSAFSRESLIILVVLWVLLILADFRWPARDFWA